jgi:hypothetical protein
MVLSSSVICGYLLLLLLSLITAEIVDVENKAYAHFTGGATKDIDSYQILFLLYPSKPVVSDNSTKLNFSILDKDKNTDVKSIFTSLTIKEKNSDAIIYQVPYKLHAFGDITFPYTFKNNTNYEAILQAKISGDPKYENTPLTASFDITAVNPGSQTLFDELSVYYVIPIIVIAIILGALIIIGKIKQTNLRKRQNKRH